MTRIDGRLGRHSRGLRGKWKEQKRMEVREALRRNIIVPSTFRRRRRFSFSVSVEIKKLSQKEVF